MSSNYKHIVYFKKTGDMVFCRVIDGKITWVGHPVFERFIGMHPDRLEAWWKNNETDDIEKPKTLKEQNEEMEKLNQPV